MREVITRLVAGTFVCPAKLATRKYHRSRGPRSVPAKYAGVRGSLYPPRSLLAGTRSEFAGVWNYLRLELYLKLYIESL